MAKLLLLFLNLPFFALWCAAQTGTSCNCNDKKVQDSLIEKYIDSRAQKHSYNNPIWGRYCDSLLTVCPNIAVAYQLKAIPFLKSGDYEKAFPLENQAVFFDPVTFTSYRAFLKCIFTKDYKGAIVDFQKTQQLVPNGYEMDHTFFFYEGLCYLELGNYTLAEKNLKQDVSVQTAGDAAQTAHFNSLFYLGVLYFEMKKYALAETYLLKCISAYKQHPEANYYLGLLYRKLKKDSLANRYLAFAKQAFENGYEMNEDNIFYVDYPHQIRLYEVEQALSTGNKK